jgi:hypothetical protein
VADPVHQCRATASARAARPTPRRSTPISPRSGAGHGKCNAADAAWTGDDRRVNEVHAWMPRQRLRRSPTGVRSKAWSRASESGRAPTGSILPTWLPFRTRQRVASRPTP